MVNFFKHCSDIGSFGFRSVHTGEGDFFSHQKKKRLCLNTPTPAPSSVSDHHITITITVGSSSRPPRIQPASSITTVRLQPSINSQ
ncbi:hypothetical protein U1Q18_017440, partial [Sarracenia purpurea var. burkii]